MASTTAITVGDVLKRGNGSTLWEAVTVSEDGNTVSVRKYGTENVGGTPQPSEKFSHASKDEIASFTPREKVARDTSVPVIGELAIEEEMPKTAASKENPYADHILASWNQGASEDRGAVLSFTVAENEADRAKQLLRSAAQSNELGVKIREITSDGATKVYFQAKIKKARKTS